MKRYLACCLAIAGLAIASTNVAAQNSQRTGSYQSILANAGIPAYNQAGAYPAPTASQFVPNQQAAPAFHADLQVAPGPTIGSSSRYPLQALPNTPSASVSTGSHVGGPCYDSAVGSNLGISFEQSSSVGGQLDCGACATAAPVYGSNENLVRETKDRNFFFGLNGLVFDRDFEDDVYLAANPAGDVIRSTDADTGTLGGVEFFLGSRKCNGNGWELRYWGLFADEAMYTLTGASFTPYIADLENVIHPTTGDNLYDIVSRSTSQTVTRDNEIHNVELSMLRRGGCYQTRFGRCANYEVMTGFRWFEFDEEFRWQVDGAAAPTSILFDTEVANTLLGYQIGGNTDVCLTDRVRFNVGTKVGIYNNRARVSQSIVDQAGVYGQVNGADFDYDNAKNDISFLGELDVSFIYQLSACRRLVTGYRAIGVSGIALGPDQYSNFNYPPAIVDVQSNNDLLLHGAFFGFEVCR